MIFQGDKEIVARCVGDILMALKPNLLSITITTRGSSEVCFVTIVTDTSSEDIVKGIVQNYFDKPTNTS